MITSSAWKGKKYAVLGLARSGRASVEALLESGAEVVAWDSKPEAVEALRSSRAQSRDLGASQRVSTALDTNGSLEFQDPLGLDLSNFDGVIVSPGVPLNTHPIKPHADCFGVPVIGDIELFAQARASLPPHKVVGITGTNGKSTTTALVHHILKTAGVPTTMGGNIGLPILEQDPLPEGGVYVLELSSYQIDLTYSLDCDVAVLLNVTPDHLDRYESFEAYVASKTRLLAMQSSDNYRLISVSTQGALSAYETIGDASLVDIEPWLPELNRFPTLPGIHNLENLAAAFYICRSVAIGLSQQQIDTGLQTYPGLPHRMERIADIGGVAFVNDSKGTNTAASAPALAAFDNVHWIVGGLAKEPGLGECEAELGHVTAAYTIGKSGPDFASLLEGRVPVERCETLERAVASAAAKAEPGDTVLLSPACASFDQFRDFEERGDRFRELVAVLRDKAA